MARFESGVDDPSRRYLRFTMADIVGYPCLYGLIPALTAQLNNLGDHYVQADSLELLETRQAHFLPTPATAHGQHLVKHSIGDTSLDTIIPSPWVSLPNSHYPSRSPAHRHRAGARFCRTFDDTASFNDHIRWHVPPCRRHIVRQYPTVFVDVKLYSRSRKAW